MRAYQWVIGNDARTNNQLELGTFYHGTDLGNAETCLGISSHTDHNFGVGNLEHTKMNMDREEKRKKTLQLVHVIEDKYHREERGAAYISSVPPEAYKELWKLWDVKKSPMLFQNRRGTVKYQSREDEVLGWLKSGYTIAETSRLTGINKTALNSIKNKYDLKIPVKFYCKLMPVDQTRSLIYCATKTAITKFLGVSFTGYKPTDTAALGKLGFRYCSLQDAVLHWSDLPDGALYLTKTGLYCKQGLDSFEKGGSDMSGTVAFPRN